MQQFNSLITLMQENPEGFTLGENSQHMADAVNAGICYEIEGWYFLHDDYLEVNYGEVQN